MRYTAFMVDIVDSKKLNKVDRETVQIFIKKCLKRLNQIYEAALVFEVVFSAGDEVQGLFKCPEAALLYFRLLRILVFPLEIRCGMGIGEWEVQIPNGTSGEQDGSAYHLARHAILQAHQNPDVFIMFNGQQEQDIYLNTLLHSSFFLSHNHNYNQNQFYLLIELMLPFYDQKIMNLQAMKELLFLQHERDNLHFYQERRNNDGFWKLRYYENLHPDPIYIFSEALFEKKICLDNTIKRGTPTRITEMLKGIGQSTSRQNIESILKNANLAFIRNLDLTAIRFLSKYYSYLVK